MSCCIHKTHKLASRYAGHAQRLAVSAICVSSLVISGAAQAAIVWDGEANTQWWFNPVNWNRDSNNNTSLPPGNSTTNQTDTQINVGTLSLPGGEGIVYDPAHDTGFPPPGSITFPVGFEGGQTIQQLYIYRAGQTGATVPTPGNLLTIKGDLTATGQVILGRSSGRRDVATFGQITQKGGVFNVTLSSLDIAQVDTSQNGYGSGVYDYQAGTLNVSRDGGAGLRLSNGSSSNATDTAPAGAAGTAKLIVHNPSTGGFIRAYEVVSAAYSGVADGAITPADANGTTKGVATFEFHYENGGVHPDPGWS